MVLIPVPTDAESIDRLEAELLGGHWMNCWTPVATNPSIMTVRASYQRRMVTRHHQVSHRSKTLRLPT